MGFFEGRYFFEAYLAAQWLLQLRVWNESDTQNILALVFLSEALCAY